MLVAKALDVKPVDRRMPPVNTTALVPRRSVSRLVNGPGMGMWVWWMDLGGVWMVRACVCGCVCTAVYVGFGLE